MGENRMDVLWDYDKVAERLGVDRRYVANLAARGLLPCIKLSPKKTRFDPRAVEDYIKRRSHGESP